MEVLVYTAHGLILATFMVRQVLPLRVLNVGATACLTAYFATLPEPLLTCVAANAFYALLNLAHVWRFFAGGRRPAVSAQASRGVGPATYNPPDEIRAMPPNGGLSPSAPAR